MPTTTPKGDRAPFTAEDTMERVLAAAPQASAILMRYHIGGCHHCGFATGDTVRKVAEDNGIPPEILLAALNQA
jgi:hypothetical protein